MGPNNTVIALKMALFEANQLDTSRDVCKVKWVVRLGEIHTVMAELRAAGNAIKTVGLVGGRHIWSSQSTKNV